ncbi:GNAT family N-acetyltransferase [Streptomyces olivoreticuli]|uniref:GNAT family N-acetyltransferase n=1 Tax=Streptomyces olivoreticuli TaxID=68246 RepID=UPI002659090E|nr:GNAT family N-acetyltransferase [Streptomyces olivoreticuli]WKK26652.1 GNAT family N-acetyltransferase [Streptomyces olivoreticuli]
MTPDIRTVTEADLPEWSKALRTGFLRPPTPSKEEIEFRTPTHATPRTQGAFDGDRCVATFRSFTQRLSMPGGADVTTDAVSNVAVSPTHRRRGLLSRMMAEDLRAARERGDAAATLIAAEYPIYGRYGFGPASWVTEWEVEVARTGLDRRYGGPEDGGRVDFADPADVREHGPGLHERMRAVRHGAVDRSERWWLTNTGALPNGKPWQEPFAVLYRSPEGTVDGLLAYTADDTWETKLPQCSATVLDLTAVTPAAERALWRFLLSVDWITRVRTGFRAPDDVLPLLLPDPRAARVLTHADHLWVRPLDVPALLEARTYASSGALVLEVTDPDGLAGGRFLLDAGPDGARCAPTGRAADLTLSVGELGTLALGDESAVRLAALGRIDEERAGAVARADVLLRTARRPWCPDIF